MPKDVRALFPNDPTVESRALTIGDVHVRQRSLVATRTCVLAVSASIAVLLGGTLARADPLPGFDLDPAVLEQRMDDCLAGVVDDKFLLMGWVSFRTGEQRRWSCGSLKHMYIRAAGGAIHDPFVDVRGFMTCVDRAVSYGFPRPGDPGNTRLVYQYIGTERQAVVVVNDSTGDVVSIWTSPPNDWTTCAGWSP